MFEKIAGFEKIGDDIFVYKNFLSSEELDKIEYLINNLSDNDWFWIEKSHKMYGKTTPNQESLLFLRKKIFNILPNEYFLGPGNCFVRYFEEDDHEVHSDAYSDVYNLREKSKNLKKDEKFELKDDMIYGLVVYFNDFEGGELYYPIQNIEYKPEKGDLVIHSADEHCSHGVRKVKSKIRYSFANQIYKKIKVPI